MFDKVITDTTKQFIIAAVLWIAGSVVFLFAVYKIYQLSQPPEASPCECGYNNNHCCP